MKYTGHSSPVGLPLQSAHEATRPANSSPLIGRALRWDNWALLQQVVRDVGFEDDKVRMEKAKTAIEVENLRTWEIQTWRVLGRTEDGWYEDNEVNWDNAVQVFSHTLRKQKGVELLNDGQICSLHVLGLGCNYAERVGEKVSAKRKRGGMTEFSGVWIMERTDRYLYRETGRSFLRGCWRLETELRTCGGKRGLSPLARSVDDDNVRSSQAYSYRIRMHKSLH